MEVKENNQQSFNLKEENELRIAVGSSPDVKIKLSSGSAEICGSKMRLNKEYSFSPHSFIAVFTWHGCVIKVSGEPKEAYIINNSFFMLNVVLHALLEERRIQAKAENKKGPVILVVGPPNAGKNMLCRQLLNYAVHQGRKPLFIDLDVGHNSISIPGTIGILKMEKPLEIIAGFDYEAEHVYQYGHANPFENIMLYLYLLRKLSETVQTVLAHADQNVQTSGIIINSCSHVKLKEKKPGYDTRPFLASLFKIDILCVYQEENLYLKMQNIMPPSVKIIFFPQTDETIRSCQKARRKFTVAAIHKYFFSESYQLQPFKFEVKFSSIQMFRFEIQCNSYKMGIPFDQIPSKVRLIPVKLSKKLVGHVVGISSADSDRQNIATMPVIGFICIADIDLAQNTFTVLSPQPGALRKRILIKGNIREAVFLPNSMIKTHTSSNKSSVGESVTFNT